MLGWNGTPGKVPARDDLLGQLSVISRPVPGGGAIGYEVNYSIRLNAWESGFKSTMQCSADRLPSLISWRTDYENHSLKHPALSWALTEQGRCEDGLLEITGKAGTRRFKTDRPVAPQWAVLDAVRAAKPDLAGLEFDLLHDLTSYRPRQKLKPCGTLDIALDGQPFQFHGFLQKGTATEPTHYWVDAAGRPLILTGGMLSLAMTSIRPA
jgi:hypothetical protein